MNPKGEASGTSCTVRWLSTMLFCSQGRGGRGPSKVSPTGDDCLALSGNHQSQKLSTCVRYGGQEGRGQEREGWVGGGGDRRGKGEDREGWGGGEREREGRNERTTFLITRVIDKYTIILFYILPREREIVWGVEREGVWRWREAGRREREEIERGEREREQERGGGERETERERE